MTTETDQGRGTSGPAPVLAIARAEVRSRWVGLLLVGLLAGVVGAVSVSGLALARRTTTAYDRLGEVTKVDDARGLVQIHVDLVDDILDLPMVTDGWSGRIGAAQVEGQNVFIGTIAGPDSPSPIIAPLVVDGRLPGASDDPDVIEVALRDDFQREAQIPLGTRFPVRFLTEEDFTHFDTGFEGGEVHGPTATIEVVGTVKLAGGFTTLPPGFASAAALESHPDAFIGGVYFVRLEDGAGGVPEFRAAVEELAEGRELPADAQEFSVVDVADTAVAAANVDHTALLLGRALLIFAVAILIVGGFAVTQALARHHLASASAHDIERALGLTKGQQAAARVLAGLIPAVIAAALTLAGAGAAAAIDPIGAIHLYEPNPGRAVNVAVVGAGTLAVFASVLAATALTGIRRQRPGSGASLRESNLVGRVSRLGGSPPTVIGLRFALEPGPGARAVPVRSAITGAVVGIAGVVAGLVFVASLDRLVSSPSRSAIPFDVTVADVRAEDLAGEVLDSPLVGDVSMVETAPLRLGGRTVDGHALEDLRGSVEIGIQEGRLPRTRDEITLGLRVARQLGVGAGDVVTAALPDGSTRDLSVVGLAVVPTVNGEELGLNALLTPEGLEASAVTDAFSEAIVEAAPGVDVDELVEFLAARFEASPEPAPVAVQNLEQLGRLPATVAATVGAIAVAALANALVVAVRRRRRDLALLRAVGFTSRQTAVAVIVMAMTIVAVGVLIGVPVGIAVGSLLWRATASGAFVLSDADLRWELLVLPVVGSVLIALAAAVLPARRAARLRPADGLRTE